MASDAASEDYFGHDHVVTISGDTIFIGSSRDDDNNQVNSGSAYVFVRADGDWMRTNKLTVFSDEAVNGNVGICVAVSGENISVGAPYTDHDDASESGVAYAFSRVA